MFGIGPTELMVILILALIVFGPKRLPEIGRTVGRSLKEVRRASEDIRSELDINLDDDDDDWEPPRVEARKARGTSAGPTPNASVAEPNGSVPEPDASALQLTGGDDDPEHPAEATPGTRG